MLKTARSYEEACRTFRWRIPDRYNLSFDVCDRQTMAGADGHRTALIIEAADGTVERYTFHVLRLLSNRLANVLTSCGVEAGERVLICASPSVEAAIAILAVLKLGGVVVPVSPGLGERPFAQRLADAACPVALLDAAVLPVFEAVRPKGGNPLVVLVPGGGPEGVTDLWSAMERASDQFIPVVTAADDPAFLFYPGDAADPPTGVFHAHRALLGNLPAVEFALDFFPRFGDLVWACADWMSMEGLLWSLLPAWHHGLPVVASSARLGPEESLALMSRHGVRAAFIPPAQLAGLMSVAAGRPRSLPRALATGPLPLNDRSHGEIHRLFGINANEIWGSLQTGAVAANNARLMEVRPGSPGRAAPGVIVEATDERGKVLRAGDRGQLSLSPNAPGGALGTWDGSALVRTRQQSGWLPSGVEGHRDLDGYLWPDVETMPVGYARVHGLKVRLADVEQTLESHPRIKEAGVWLDPVKGLRAGVVLNPGDKEDLALVHDLKSLIARLRAVHEVPARFDFVAEIPRTAEGTVDSHVLLSRPLRVEAPSPEERWG